MTALAPGDRSDGTGAERRLVVPARFCGPPGMGNGGWVAGSLAAHVAGLAVEVTLRAPAPLDESLTVRSSVDRAELVAGETLCAVAVPTDPLNVSLPSPVGHEAAVTASRGFVGHTMHPFPTCFVCGPVRDPDDALRIFPGPVDGRDGVVAAPWVPSRSLTVDGAGDTVCTAAIWAALDCPTGWAHYRPGGVALLGRHTVEVHRAVRAGETYVVVAERGHADGRKLHATAALFAADGTIHAAARSLWIEIA